MKIEKTESWKSGTREVSTTEYFDTYTYDDGFELAMSGDCCIETDYYHDAFFGFVLNKEKARELWEELGAFLGEPVLKLKLWDTLSDPYDADALADNFRKIDVHSQESGRGTPIIDGGGLLPCPDCGLTTPDPKAFCTTCTVIGD
jgi:hypothetical protein